MNTEKQAIIEKIKKLLRMKRGGTPDEIATALRLAQELAEKHGIDLNKVNPDEDAERPIGHKDHVHGARVQWECTYAAMICDEFFNVRVFQAVSECRSKYVMRFVGTAWDTEIAIYVYTFLCGHFRREWNSHKRSHRLRDRQTFMWGMYIGLSLKLRERQPKTVQQPGIVVVDRQLTRRNDYIKARWELTSESARPDGDASKARMAGFMAGQETEIRSGVKTAEERAALASGAPQLTC